MTESGILDDVELLVFEDTDGTLKQLADVQELITERLAAVRVGDAREIVKQYKITEPLREGIDKLSCLLHELRGKLSAVRGQMSVASELLAEARAQAQGNLAHVEIYREELFGHQMQAAMLMMSIEEQEEHMKAVTDRLGAQQTLLQLDRAAATIEMHDKLSAQLVDMARLTSWFNRKKEEHTAS